MTNGLQNSGKPTNSGKDPKWGLIQDSIINVDAILNRFPMFFTLPLLCN